MQDVHEETWCKRLKDPRHAKLFLAVAGHKSSVDPQAEYKKAVERVGRFLFRGAGLEKYWENLVKKLCGSDVVTASQRTSCSMVPPSNCSTVHPSGPPAPRDLHGRF